MEYFAGNYTQFSSLDNANVNNTSSNNNNINAVNFTVDDLLDFSKEDETMTDTFFDNLAGNSNDSSTVTAVDSCNSSISGSADAQFNGNVSCRSFNDSHFSGTELCVPYDDIAELEWLSNFVEESFSTEDLHFIPTSTTNASASASASASAPAKPSITDTSSSMTTTDSERPVLPPIFPTDVSVPGKARSKRSRAAPCDWSSRLLLLSPFSSKKNEPITTETPGRKCLHCASEKTPQWRTGPMGPKTLCNACGVRYKSGRLVPEYRPASSPTFISAKHSNSHRKVLELRRQKDVVHHHHHHHHQLIGHQIYNGCDEFLIHNRNGINGHDFRHMM